MRTARIAAALLGPVVAGVAMSFGQTYLPAWWGSLANSAFPVVVVMVACALAARRLWASALLGGLAGPLVMLGYFVTAEVRGFPASSFWVLFWCTAGVVAGVAAGAAVWRLRRPENGPGGRVAAALAAGMLPGVVVGEAAHGLLRISDTTSVGCWWMQTVVGIGALVLVAITCLSSAAARTLSVLGAAAVGTALFLVYGVA